MNKIYKVIWCQALCTWVAVSELAKGKVKSSAVSTKKQNAIQQKTKFQIPEWKLKAVAALLLGFSANLYAAQGITGGIATGTDATAISSNCVSSNQAKASNGNTIAIGCGSTGLGSGAVAMGHGASATNEGSIAIGGTNGASLDYFQPATSAVQDVGERKISIVSSTVANANSAGVVVAKVDGNALRITFNASGQATAVSAYLQKSDGTAVDINDPSTYYRSFSYSGTEAQSIFNSLQTGGALSAQRQTIALGTGSSALTGQSVAIGAQASAYGDQSVAIGANTRTLGSSSIAIGGDDLIVASGAINGGTYNSSDAAKLYKKLTGNDFLDLNNFYAKTTTGDGAIAIGVQSQANDLSAALGTRTRATGLAATAVGTGADASKGGSIALGAGSTTNTDAVTPTGATIGVVNLAGNQVGTLNYNFAGAFAGHAEDVGRQVSVGNVGNERQIKNVAPGVISRTSTDAINGSQLVAVVEGIVANFDDTAAVVYTQQNGTPVKKAANGKWYKAADINQDGSLVSGAVEVAPNTIITSVKSADGSTTAPTTLTNVKDGGISATSKDAINGSQLKGAMDSTATVLGGGASYNPVTNTFNNPTYNLINAAGNTAGTATNVGAALTNLNTYVNKGFDIQQRGTKVSTVAPESKVNFIDGNNTVAKVALPSAGVTTVTFDVNSQGVVNGAQLPVVYTDASGNPVYKQPNGTWNTSVDGNGTSVPAANIITSVQSAAGSTTVPTTLANVKDGVNGNDAVNVSQLKASSSKVEAGTNVAITPVSTADGTTYTVDADSSSVTATSGKLTVSKGAKDANNNTAYDVDLSAATQADIQKGVDADTAVKTKGLTFTGDSGTTGVKKLGDSVAVTGDANILTAANASGVQVKLNPALTGLTSVSITGGPTINNGGINMNNTKITNLTAGTDPNDAVNLSQLGTAVSNASLNFEGDVAAAGAPANNFSRKVGQTTKIVGGIIDSTQLTDDNIGVESDGAGKLTVKLAKNLQALDSVSITGGPTMNNGGINMNGKKITNLAAGIISSTSQEAVNGSQLYNVSNSIKTSIGGNTVINPDGSITTFNLGDTGKDNIHDALKTINNTATNANKGWKLSTNGGAAAQVVPDQQVDFSNTDNNVKITNTGSNVTVNLNNNLNLSPAGSVTMGNTTVNNGGLTIQNTDPNKVVSVTDQGINAGNNKVTNVQDGLIADGSKDAVNGGQIKNIADSIKNSIGGNTVVNPDGTITTNNIGNTGANNIHDAISQVNTAATKAKTTVTQGANIVVTPSTNPDGSTNYQVATAKDVSFDNVNVSNNVTVGGKVTANEFKAGNTSINNNGITIANTDPNKVVSVTDAGISAGGNKVTNVAPGTISSSSTDAVNGSQLNASNNAFNSFLGGGATYNDNTKTYGAPTYVINNGSTTNSYNNVGDALGALNQADTTINNRIDVLGDQLEQSFRTTNNRIDDVEKLANAGVAAAMSLENAPYIAGKFTYAVGAAYHGGENAVGATLRRTADNGRWSLTGGIAAASQGDPSVRIGISGVID